MTSWKPSVISIFLTRRCNLNCPHCMLRNDSAPEKPVEYWTRQIVESYDTLGKPIIFLYGGEPTVYMGKPHEHLLKLIENLCREHGIYVALATNAVLWNRETVREYLKAGLTNITVSIDPPSHYEDKRRSLHSLRTSAGFKLLTMFKEEGLQDLHATITLYPYNYRNLPVVLELLTELGSWIEVTFCMWRKTEHYTAFPHWRHFLTEQEFRFWTENAERIAQEVIQMLHEFRWYKKFYVPPHLWRKEIFVKLIRAEYICKKPFIHLDSDGYARLCRDITGLRVRKYQLSDIASDIERYLVDWHSDMRELCKGCNHTCSLVQDYAPEKIHHIE